MLLGLHINLSEGVPVSNVQAVRSLLSVDKVFLGKTGIRIALESGALNADEVHLLYTQLKCNRSLQFSFFCDFSCSTSTEMGMTKF